MHYLLIILKIIIFTLLCTSFSNVHARDRVFLLAGQSNMQGLGAVYQLKHWQKRTPHNVKFYTRGSRHPVPLVRGGRFGPEVAFAHKLSRSFPHDRIIMIKVAAGGTPITQWMPGTRNYRAIINQAKHAMRHSRSKTTVDAILWMQGESDASTPHRAHRYGGNLRRVISHLRRDLRSPHSVFMIGQVNPLVKRFPLVDTVRAKQMLVHRQVRNTQLVPTRGLSKMRDQLHYDTKGQLQLGQRFAAAYFRTQHRRPGRRGYIAGR